MSFGVFIHREDSQYNDYPHQRYQFPKQYLSRAKQFNRGYVLYYEPTKVKNSRGYYAAAKIENIIPDPSQAGMFLALIEPKSYFEFPNPVEFKVGESLVEKGLYNDKGGISGRAQSAVRPVSEEDFNRILNLGLSFENELLPRLDSEIKELEVHETQLTFQHEDERLRSAYTGNRIIRDPIFRRSVLNAYDERCSVTGLKIINGGGRAEVQAAHIKPVAENGPDSIRNGIALSGTVHWMFDRGLISLENNLKIKISRHVNDRDSISALINQSGYATPPNDERHMPHPHYLEWHRTNCFKT